MKKYLLSAALFFSIALPSHAQTMADDAKVWAEEWKYAFSADGRQAWKPEFTARVYAGLFFTGGGPAVTGGIRIDNKRTLGLMLWTERIWIDSVPAHVNIISAGLYKRRYFLSGKKDVVSFYSDLAVGAGYVYEDTRGYNPETGETVKTAGHGKGDILFSATWQPGIRFRFWRNLHLFLGPYLSTNAVGLHLGVGL